MNKHVHVKRDERCGFLFRVEPAQPPVILVQSAEEPRWDYAFGNAGFLLARPPQVKAFQPQFAAGQVWRFRLRANPTVKRQKKRHGLTSEDEQRAWLQRKGIDRRIRSPFRRGRSGRPVTGLGGREIPMRCRSSLSASKGRFT